MHIIDSMHFLKTWFTTVIFEGFITSTSAHTRHVHTSVLGKPSYIRHTWRFFSQVSVTIMNLQTLNVCNSHLKGFSPRWMPICHSVLSLYEHTHLTSEDLLRITVHIFMFMHTHSLSENVNPQQSHVIRLSSAWVRKCFFKHPIRENRNPQQCHTKGLSSEKVHRWLLRLPFWVKHNPHLSHNWRVSPQYECSCVGSSSISKQSIIHTCLIYMVSLQDEFADASSTVISK